MGGLGAVSLLVHEAPIRRMGLVPANQHAQSYKKNNQDVFSKFLRNVFLFSKSQAISNETSVSHGVLFMTDVIHC